MLGINMFNIKSIKFYGYRSADVSDIFVGIDRNSDDGKLIEEMLWEFSGARPDNHVVFEVTTNHGNKLAYKLSDRQILVGMEVVEKYW